MRLARRALLGLLGALFAGALAGVFVEVATTPDDELEALLADGAFG